MRICLNLDSSRLLRWHVWLAKALAEVPGNDISRAIAAERRPFPLGSRLLFELERLVWFFLSQRLWRSSSWDILNLYHADRLTGSRTSHAATPVLIDARLSRPAAAFIQRDGAVLRPVQDCARGYGGGVTFCRIDALGASEFAQTPVGRIRSGPFRCDTYNRRSGLEIVDLFGQIRGLQEVTISYAALAPDRRSSAAPGQPILGADGNGEAPGLRVV